MDDFSESRLTMLVSLQEKFFSGYIQVNRVQKFTKPLAQSTLDAGHDAAQIRSFSFDVACVQCGHPHSHQQAPFACIVHRVPPPVWIGPFMHNVKTLLICRPTALQGLHESQTFAIQNQKHMAPLEKNTNTLEPVPFFLHI